MYYGKDIPNKKKFFVEFLKPTSPNYLAQMQTMTRMLRY